MLKENLLQLLKEVYPMLYTNPAEYESVVNKVSDMSENEIVQYADEKPEECFQLDSYPGNDYMRHNNKRI